MLSRPPGWSTSQAAATACSVLSCRVAMLLSLPGRKPRLKQTRRAALAPTASCRGGQHEVPCEGMWDPLHGRRSSMWQRLQANATGKQLSTWVAAEPHQHVGMAATNAVHPRHGFCWQLALQQTSCGCYCRFLDVKGPDSARAAHCPCQGEGVVAVASSGINRHVPRPQHLSPQVLGNVRKP